MKLLQRNMEKVAKSMLQQGTDLRFIQEVTGLSEEAIQKLIDK